MNQESVRELERILVEVLGIPREDLDSEKLAAAASRAAEQLDMQVLLGVPAWDELHVKRFDDGRQVDVVPLIGNRGRVVVTPAGGECYDDVW